MQIYIYIYIHKNIAQRVLRYVKSEDRRWIRCIYNQLCFPFFFFFIKHEQKMPIFISHWLWYNFRVVYKCTNYKCIERFSPSISALATSNLKEMSVYIIRVCMYSMMFFTWENIFRAQTTTQNLSQNWKCCRASSFFLLHVFFSLRLHSVNSSLASLVIIILCPLHDCYKLCKQRQRC